MRAEIVHVTDHALLRWSQRVSEKPNVFDIKNAIQKSKVIKKCEPLPYPLPRLDGSVYSVHNGIMFVMEPITIDEYRLVTVVSEFIPIARPPRKPNKKEEKQKKVLEKKKQLRETQQKKKDREENERPQRTRPKTQSVYVQSTFSRLPDMAPEGNEGLQQPVEQDSAA